MTYATGELKAARSLLLTELDMHPGSGSYPADLDPGEVGIVGDRPHVLGGASYHLGADDLDMSSDPYSARTTRDRAGLTDAASAVDVGEFKVTTPRGTFTHRDLALWSVAQCQANHPDTRDIREIIYSPDGVRVFRYDRERGHASKPVERIPADNHRSHNHYSQYRDATKARRTTLRDHFARWLNEIGLGDDMADSDQLTTTNWRILEGMLQLKDQVNDHVNKAPQTNEMARILRRIEASSAQTVKLVELLAAAIAAGGGNLDTVAVLARIDERAAEGAARDAAAASRIAELEADVARLEAELAAVPDAVAAELHQRTES